MLYADERITEPPTPKNAPVVNAFNIPAEIAAAAAPAAGAHHGAVAIPRPTAIPNKPLCAYSGRLFQASETISAAFPIAPASISKPSPARYPAACRAAINASLVIASI